MQEKIALLEHDAGVIGGAKAQVVGLTTVTDVLAAAILAQVVEIAGIVILAIVWLLQTLLQPPRQTGYLMAHIQLRLLLVLLKTGAGTETRSGDMTPAAAGFIESVHALAALAPAKALGSATEAKK